MQTVRVEASSGYDVIIGGGLLKSAGERVAAVCGGEKCLIVTDDIVAELYADTLEKSLKAVGFETARFVFPNGEGSKNLAVYTALLEAMAGANLARSDLVAALGGGVTGDLAGFAAASYMRGIGFAQLPTTLLAMTDSSVGGKTGVDLAAGKNLVGAFYQPELVLCDYDTLKTLPRETFNDGCAEMVKHGVILSRELFDMLKNPIEPQIEDVIARNVAIKRDIVQADERERGIRRILNFGHTIGHAVEKLSGYKISHGGAVAIGMALVSRGAWRLGLCGRDCYEEILDALERFSLPTATDFSPEKLAGAAYFDKKRNGQNVSLILPEEIGSCVIRDFSLNELADFLSLAAQN